MNEFTDPDRHELRESLYAIVATFALGAAVVAAALLWHPPAHVDADAAAAPVCYGSTSATRMTCE